MGTDECEGAGGTGGAAVLTAAGVALLLASCLAFVLSLTFDMTTLWPSENFVQAGVSSWKVQQLIAIVTSPCLISLKMRRSTAHETVS